MCGDDDGPVEDDSVGKAFVKVSKLDKKVRVKTKIFEVIIFFEKHNTLHLQRLPLFIPLLMPYVYAALYLKSKTMSKTSQVKRMR